jgi:hypothetical protein
MPRSRSNVENEMRALYSKNTHARSDFEAISTMKPASFSSTSKSVHQEIERRGLPLFDMRRERHLELRLAGGFGSEPGARSPGEAAAFNGWIEEPFPASRIVPKSTERTAIRFFLDGSQRTLPAYHCGTVPIMTAISAAAVLERSATGEASIVKGTLRLKHAWIAPRKSHHEPIQHLVDLVATHGGEIIDPLDGLDDEAYQEMLNDYAGMETCVLRAARALRAQLEEQLLDDWLLMRDPSEPGWIVVDGALRRSAPRAVGLVKSFTRQYLTGPHAEALFSLPQGHRTPAFQIVDKWRESRNGDDPSRTAWYLRMWDSAGRDPRHALIRVETAASVQHTDEIDAISSWLLAERIPRATADSRWATLLYPVHFLEQILKRHVDAQTRSWPAPH